MRLQTPSNLLEGGTRAHKSWIEDESPASGFDDPKDRVHDR